MSIAANLIQALSAHDIQKIARADVIQQIAHQQQQAFWAFNEDLMMWELFSKDGDFVALYEYERDAREAAAKL